LIPFNLLIIPVMGCFIF